MGSSSKTRKEAWFFRETAHMGTLQYGGRLLIFVRREHMGKARYAKKPCRLSHHREFKLWI